MQFGARMNKTYGLLAVLGLATTTIDVSHAGLVSSGFGSVGWAPSYAACTGTLREFRDSPGAADYATFGRDSSGSRVFTSK